VLVGVRVAAHAVGVQPPLVEKGGRPQVGTPGVGGPVRQRVELLRELGELAQPSGGEHPPPQLELEVGRHHRQIGVATALTAAVHRPLDHARARLDRRQRRCHRQAGVVVAVDTHHRPEACHHLSHRPGNRPGQAAPVGVAESEPAGAGTGRGGQRFHGVPGIGSVPVEEVLGVEDHLPAPVHRQLHRLGDHH
jgi:hypothetical protein